MNALPSWSVHTPGVQALTCSALTVGARFDGQRAMVGPRNSLPVMGEICDVQGTACVLQALSSLEHTCCASDSEPTIVCTPALQTGA